MARHSCAACFLLGCLHLAGLDLAGLDLAGLGLAGFLLHRLSGRFPKGARPRQRLAAPQRLGDERIGEQQPGLVQVVERQGDEALRLAGGIGPFEHHIAVGNAAQQAAETLAARHRKPRRDLCLVAGPALEIGGANQRPVDARRRDLEMIGPIDRILTSRTGDRPRLTASQSSTPMLPSGRSAMICNVSR